MEDPWQVESIDEIELAGELCDEDNCRTLGLFRVLHREDLEAVSPPLCREHARIVARELNDDERMKALEKRE